MSDALPRSDHDLPGLTGDVEVLTDRWGVPHVDAGSQTDAFRAQGWLAGRDRLWQVDQWRRRGLGLLAEVYGPDYVAHDRAARLFLYRGGMDEEWAAYAPGTRDAAEAFVDGLNAYVRLVRAEPERLPPEFTEVGYLPAFWDASDVPRIRAHGLYSNVRQEVARALTLRDHGDEGLAAEALRRRLEPPHTPQVPDGLDVTLVPDDVLAVYDLATLPVVLSPGEAPAPGPAPEGSNNWVLAGSCTATGRPLLANDPHRAVSLPSLRWLCHLRAPGLDVVGAGEPALPGVSIGHNGTLAFGLTIFSADQEDLYAYRTHPDDARRYRYGDGWEPMRVVRETVPVAGAPDVEVELVFTRHGPVISADPLRHSAFAVRAAWLEPGMAPYLGSLGYLRARSPEEFLAAMTRWGAPPENQVYAGVDGRVGWTAGARAPVRPGWDGTLPVPGDGRYEWSGYLDASALPRRVDPPSGWVATANEMNLAPGTPPEHVVGYDWSPPYRRRRIDEVLAASTGVTAADLVRLQTDVLSLPARAVVARLAHVTGDQPAVRDAMALLARWDARLSADSAAAALFEVWYRRHLRPALLARALAEVVGAGRATGRPRPAVTAEDVAGDPRVDLDILAAPVRHLGPDGERVLDALLTDTLADAVADVTGLLGPDPSRWAWGRLHVARPTHPLAGRMPGVAADRLTLGPLARGGSPDTVMATGYTPDLVQSHGASFRVVVDVGDWDASLAMNAPGQSGDPRSPHYDDLLPLWAADGAFPLLYSREAVEAAAEHRLVLHPARPGAPGD